MTETSCDTASPMGSRKPAADEVQDPVVLDMIEALDSVPDPCCVLSGKDLSVLDLGLINRIEREGDTVTIGITLTDTMCEFSHKIISDIESLASMVPEVGRVVVVPEVLPIWSTDRLSDHARTMIREDSIQFFRNWDFENPRAGPEK